MRVEVAESLDQLKIGIVCCARSVMVSGKRQSGEVVTYRGVVWRQPGDIFNAAPSAVHDPTAFFCNQPGTCSLDSG
jgi:hypothetical protein